MSIGRNKRRNISRKGGGINQWVFYLAEKKSARRERDKKKEGWKGLQRVWKGV